MSGGVLQRPETPAERSYVAQGFTIRTFGGRPHQIAQKDVIKPFERKYEDPGLNGPCKVLVKNGKALNAAGERLLAGYKKSAK